MKFTIIDTVTGEPPDLDDLQGEPWASELLHGSEGFAVGEDGTVYLLDKCGNYAYAPLGRFTVKIQEGNQ